MIEDKLNQEMCKEIEKICKAYADVASVAEEIRARRDEFPQTTCLIADRLYERLAVFKNVVPERLQEHLFKSFHLDVGESERYSNLSRYTFDGKDLILKYEPGTRKVFDSDSQSMVTVKDKNSL